MGDPPAWLNIVSLGSLSATGLSALDPGERQAIALAVQQHAALLIDDREGVLQAQKLNLEVVGTLAVRVRAAQRGWVQLPEMFRRLRAISSGPRSILWSLLEEDALRKK